MARTSSAPCASLPSRGFDAVEAELVRLIFRLYVEGDGTSGRFGVKETTQWLYERGHVTRCGATFGSVRFMAFSPIAATLAASGRTASRTQEPEAFTIQRRSWRSTSRRSFPRRCSTRCKPSWPKTIQGLLRRRTSQCPGVVNRAKRVPDCLAFASPMAAANPNPFASSVLGQEIDSRAL
jgi:hypothetical protein